MKLIIGIEVSNYANKQIKYLKEMASGFVSQINNQAGGVSAELKFFQELENERLSKPTSEKVETKERVRQRKERT